MLLRAEGHGSVVINIKISPWARREGAVCHRGAGRAQAKCGSPSPPSQRKSEMQRAARTALRLGLGRPLPVLPVPRRRPGPPHTCARVGTHPALSLRLPAQPHVPVATRCGSGPWWGSAHAPPWHGAQPAPPTGCLHGGRRASWCPDPTCPLPQCPECGEGQGQGGGREGPAGCAGSASALGQRSRKFVLLPLAHFSLSAEQTPAFPVHQVTH